MTALWISEQEVVDLMGLGEAIDALEAGLRLQAEGGAQNMSKTHVTWGGHNTLHAIGASFEAAGYIGTKTWAHTEGGATPLLIIWDSNTGALTAIIEAFALGQMRTGGISGVAARWMSAKDSDVMALVGTGKQAITQVAAVAAVRPLKEVRVFSPTPEKRRVFVEKLAGQGFSFAVREATSVEEATDGAPIVTLVTRAREPFFTNAMAAKGAHINAVGAITPEREEFSQDLVPRIGLVAADDPAAMRRLSREFMTAFGDDDIRWAGVKPLAELVAAGKGRAEGCDISVFKAMGMGVSDMSLGIEILRRAREKGVGKPVTAPVKAAPRLI